MNENNHTILSARSCSQQIVACCLVSAQHCSTPTWHHHCFSNAWCFFFLHAAKGWHLCETNHTEGVPITLAHVGSPQLVFGVLPDVCLLYPCSSLMP